ncbi:MAG: energy-coupling factor transporter ATPase [Clostridiaceae bacterium]|nr:energy-coupling factor transporter ATPase [Clostridiaceae bacterium]
MIEVRNLSYTYSKNTPFEHKALDNISFKAESGEFIGVIGHTGSGKSTLMQQLNGLLKPDAGTVLLDGQDIYAKGVSMRSVRSRVGLVFQYPEYQLFEETVYRDIAFGPKNMGLSEEEVKDRVYEAARFVDFDEEILKKSPFELSGGQKRRAAIAGVLAMQPDVLVLDEPTAGLDPYSRERLLAQIRDYHDRKNATILLVTHSMEDIAATVGRIIVMNESRILMDGTPEQVFARAEELVAIGLDVPQITHVFMELERRGVSVGTSIYTVKYAARLLTDLLKKEGGAC